MSRPNSNQPPALSFIDAEGSYLNPEPRIDSDSLMQWPQPDSRSMPNTPSPLASVRRNPTAMYLSQHINMNQRHVQQADSTLDPNLPTMLAVPHARRPSSAMSNTTSVDQTSSPVFSHYPEDVVYMSNSTGSVHNSNPPQNMNYIASRTYGQAPDSLFSRMYGDLHDEPWNPMRMADNRGPPLSFGAYRENAASDIDSVVAPRSDSGYCTHPAQSVISNEPERVDHDMPHGILQIDSLNVGSRTSESVDLSTNLQSDQVSQYSGRSASQSKSAQRCPRCHEVSKCPSDFKKHMLKHDKPHTCDVYGCRRAAQGKGFTTINDLQRHKKSVHRIGVEKGSYQCASEHCRNRGKIWPRLDNFKQHINRMHKGEDEQELIRKSEYQEPYTPSVLTPTDQNIALAGIGTERQVAGSELDDPASGISLTPDQDHNPWASFGPTSQDNPLDIDPKDPHGNNYLFDTIPHFRNKSAGQFLVSISHKKDIMRSRQDLLQIPTEIASTQPASPTAASASALKLSSAPQTKAEQQHQQMTQAEQHKLALQKFGQALLAELHADPTSGTPDLANTVLRVLSRTGSKQTSTTLAEPSPEEPVADTSMTETDVVKLSQVISNIVRQRKNAPTSSRSRRSSKGNPPEKIQCQHCNTTTARACDMKKHMKRHTRPYGCTYPRCHKNFGAKSDWKRHENSQHFQLESFRCLLEKPGASTACGEFFHREEEFKNHIKNEHQITEGPMVQEQVNSGRIGKNVQGQFWCGFCKKIIKLKEKRNAAWDERFDHIDKHFNQERRGIDDWMCVETRKNKGAILKEMKKDSSDEDFDDGSSESDNSAQMAEDVEIVASSSTLGQQPDIHNSSKKREHTVEDVISEPALKRRRTDVERYCCHCGNGPWAASRYVHCIICHHHLCSNCQAIPTTADLDASLILDEM